MGSPWWGDDASNWDAGWDGWSHQDPWGPAWATGKGAGSGSHAGKSWHAPDMGKGKTQPKGQSGKDKGKGKGKDAFAGMYWQDAMGKAGMKGKAAFKGKGKGKNKGKKGEAEEELPPPPASEKTGPGPDEAPAAKEADGRFGLVSKAGMAELFNADKPAENDDEAECGEEEEEEDEENDELAEPSGDEGRAGPPSDAKLAEKDDLEDPKNPPKYRSLLSKGAPFNFAISALIFSLDSLFIHVLEPCRPPIVEPHGINRYALENLRRLECS